MERLLEGVGAALGAMPPALSALVIMGLAIGALAYFWRRAGIEAASEKREAAAARQVNEGLRSDALNRTLTDLVQKVDKVQEAVDDVAGDVTLLLDRSMRK